MSRLNAIPYSLLDLAPIVEGGTVAQALRNTTRLAQHAEALGFTRYWLAEHHNIAGVASAATAVLIGQVAAQTASIRVGSGGIMLPNHAPLVVAEQFGTLEALFPGRIDLGLGRAPGTDPQTARALRRDAFGGDAFPDLVAELRAYLAPADPGRKVQAIPGTGSGVPVWLLGSSLYSAHLAAELGLPYAFAAHFAPAALHDALAVYRSGFRPSAVLAAPYAMVGVPFIAADSDERARMLATTMYQKFLGLVRGRPRPMCAPLASMDGAWLPHEESAVRAMLACAVVGGPAEVRSGLQRLLDFTLADEIMITCDCFEFEDRLRSCEILAAAMREG
ncbi:LLM class flavin-dependent oxidoreductase [Paludibacterium yongneupense]|uniref:LLM class flavin-dependent oxidoreductase n=1 Tax=Paludibacterium yongneupense TaxID=400061 RepID=UPI0003FFAE17|nr:LLM class flavin-dependent oxidoreductase [Paludibacterium yongneupense]